MKLLLVYHERLGDICRCLPIAEYFAGQGWEVMFECKPQYHGLFQVVGYCWPIAPGGDWRLYDRVIDLQVWPNRFDDFTRSGLNWMDYVYGLFPEGPGIDREISLCVTATPDVPDWVPESCLVFPTGYSQKAPPIPNGVLIHAHMLFPGTPVAAVGKAEHGCFELSDIPTLVAWIWRAKYVLTVNTAASIIASAVRQSWHHIPDLDPQHDFTHHRQIRVGRLA